MTLVSVVIPAFNAARFLGAALETVFGQEYRPIEVIVVDDGSTDGTCEAARRFPGVRLLRQENGGAASARNRGVSEASGPFLAFLDADDLWTPGKLARQAAVLEEDPSVDMVFGHMVQFRDTEGNASAPDSPPTPSHFAGSMLVRRKAFLRVGPFPTGVRVGEFLDWYMKAQEAGLRAVTLPDILLKRRRHEANLGVRERSAKGDYVRVLKAALDRRRQG